uniref:Uncharacterized protein n=1 Tax=Arundo donax TaxID=35708 RepID=A0A0A9F3N5_ARUDO
MKYSLKEENSLIAFRIYSAVASDWTLKSTSM